MTSRTSIRLVITLMAITGGAYLLTTDIASQDSAAASIAEREAHRRERIQAIGGFAAYRELTDEIATHPPEEQHVAAHTFGAALYAVEGTRGLAVCDAQFSFGCFHEFLGRAIADLGLASVGDLNDACREALGEQSLSCQHGIGHGLVAHVGYEDSELERSLRICRDLPFNDPIGGCYGGVFMEYNLRTMLEQAPLREGTDLMQPCASLETEYARACYFWQPQWWLQRTIAFEGKEKNSTEAFSEIGRHCKRAGDETLQRSCFEGIGNIATEAADFDGARTAELCDAVSSELLPRLYCRSIAANSLHTGGAGKKGNADIVCRDLPAKAAAYCGAYARNEANILVELDFSTFE